MRLSGLLVLVMMCAAPAAAGDWLAGTASTVITPEEAIWLAGYAGRSHPADGTRHDLWVKAVALETPDGEEAVIVSCDLLGLTAGMYANIAGAVQTQLGLDPSQILLNASHTHCGPALKDALVDIYPYDDWTGSDQTALIAAYTDMVEDAFVDTISRAMSARVPCTLSYGKGSADFAINRRTSGGPTDHDVAVLRIAANDGSHETVLCNYACHATTLNDYYWCGDYPGYAQIALEGAAANRTAMFLAGCGADQNPSPRRQVAYAEQHGLSLATAVETVLAGSMRTISPQLSTDIRYVDLEYGDQPTEAELISMSTQGGYTGRWAARMLEELQTTGPFPTHYRDFPVQAWRLGEDALLVSLGGEVVVDYSLRLKQMYGEDTIICGYTNDVMAYIPSERIRQEGGYEAMAASVYGLPAYNWAPGIEENILGAVIEMVGEPVSPPVSDYITGVVYAYDTNATSLPHANYPDSSGSELTDYDRILPLTADFFHPGWVGFRDPADDGLPHPGITFDLGGVYLLEGIHVTYLGGNVAKINSPDEVRVSFSEDGITFTDPADASFTPFSPATGDLRVEEAILDVLGSRGRYVKLDFYNDGMWTFLGEVGFMEFILPGDANGDGFVNSSDLDIVRAHWGLSVPPSDAARGDLSGDGFVNSQDLDLVRANWGAGLGAVPEPGAFAAILLGFIAWIGCRGIARAGSVIGRTR